jgi:hypothetical protein
MRRIVILASIALSLSYFFSSCAKGISPFDAANGKAKCGRHIR